MPKAKSNSNTAMVEALRRVLADTYVLGVKTHGYHWNVTGPQFPQLHTLFETQYTEMFTAADVLAERIRALGALAPSGMKQMLEMSGVSETAGKNLNAKAMLKDLIVSHNKMVDDLKATADLADEIDDDVTESMLTDRLEAHQKTIWMLKSTAA